MEHLKDDTQPIAVIGMTGRYPPQQRLLLESYEAFENGMSNVNHVCSLHLLIVIAGNRIEDIRGEKAGVFLEHSVKIGRTSHRKIRILFPCSKCYTSDCQSISKSRIAVAYHRCIG